MKHQTQTFIAGFVTAFAFMGCIFFLSFSTPEKAEDVSGLRPVSTAISWNEAVSMRTKYVARTPLKMEVSGNQVPLEGFTIQANQLSEIISNNKSGGNADAVMFYFGAEDPAPGSTLPKYHLIAVGIKNNALMIPSDQRDRNDPTKSSVYDKADPCPPFCPN